MTFSYLTRRVAQWGLALEFRYHFLPHVICCSRALVHARIGFVPQGSKRSCSFGHSLSRASHENAWTINANTVQSLHSRPSGLVLHDEPPLVSGPEYSQDI